MKYPKNLEYVKASQDASDNLDMSTEATNAELNEAITDEFGVKYSKDGRKLLKAPKELKGTYSVKKGTEIICAGSFIYCESLRSLVLPAGVTTICNSAFWCCSSLSSLVIPDSVTCIGESAFMSCTSLFSLVIPDSITNIGDSVFWGSNLPNDLKQELISRFGEKIFR
ncbi:leucine-rich repeat domain-containing protein [Segatella copri]|uniref:leucine-rich repeat domain-containing protein n=1 Tax=Segatella copri TaxID=165179 RepID=UPI003F9A1CBA